jgi:uncharacterized protein (TIGR03067 family)
MRTCILAVLFLGLWASAADPLPKELADLQGVWKLTTFEINEDEGPPQGEFRLHFQGNKINYGGTLLATATLDSKNKPPSIDLAFATPARTLEGIYSLEGDTFKICVNKRSEGVKERPQEFTTKEQPDFRILTFTRIKGEKVDPLEGLNGFVGVQIRVNEDPKEVVIVATIKDSPAAKAGLKKDDVLLQVNNNEVKELRPTVEMIRKIKPGSTVNLRVRRDGKEMDVTVKAIIMPFFILD